MTTRVKMREAVTGTRNNQDWPPRGGVVELPEDEAESYVKAGIAERSDDPVTHVFIEPVAETEVLETVPRKSTTPAKATVGAPENAAAR